MKVPSWSRTDGGLSEDSARRRVTFRTCEIHIVMLLLAVLVLACGKRSTTGSGTTVREGRVEEGQLRSPTSSDAGYNYGYRVQLYATRDIDKARRVAESAQRLFSADVYIEYYEPLYKVRIGDYPDREQAEHMRQHVSSRGFGDAWIVETTIRKTERQE